VLDLWARRNGLPLHNAAVDLASRFGIVAQKPRGGTRKLKPVLRTQPASKRVLSFHFTLNQYNYPFPTSR